MTRALIVVDVQNDFVNGSLAVEGGDIAAARITRLLSGYHGYDTIVATADWHTDDTHDHFAPEGTDPNFSDTWPVHCMAGTDGAELHDNLDLPDGTPLFLKGQTEASYSGFDGALADGTRLADYLRARGVTDVDVVGIAFDFCVKATAIDAVNEGFTTTVVTELTAAVSPATAEQATSEMAAANVAIDNLPAVA